MLFFTHLYEVSILFEQMMEKGNMFVTSIVLCFSTTIEHSFTVSAEKERISFGFQETGWLMIL